jgi:hypothetical protein
MVQMFPGRVSLWNGDVAWPQRPPDLSPYDHFLWGYLKLMVYENQPTTIYKLWDSIRTTVLQIPVNMLRKTMDSLRWRAQDCLQNNGGQLTDVVVKN